MVTDPLLLLGVLFFLPYFFIYYLSFLFLFCPLPRRPGPRAFSAAAVKD